MKKINVLLLLFLTLTASGQGNLQTVKITKDISMKISDELIPMSEAERIQKYVSSRVPLAMFSTQDQQVDLGINLNSTQWAGELTILRDFYKSNILNLFNSVEFISEEIREINGREFIAFEFIGQVQDEENVFGNRGTLGKYIFIQYSLYNDQVLLFNFSCPARLRPQWEDIAREMMNSVKIR